MEIALVFRDLSLEIVIELFLTQFFTFPKWQVSMGKLIDIVVRGNLRDAGETVNCLRDI